MHIKSVVFAGAVALGLMSTAASATIVTETFTGTISSGIDVLGLFGARNANLEGLTYTAQFVFDT
jgi:hypothetical protein